MHSLTKLSSSVILIHIDYLINRLSHFQTRIRGSGHGIAAARMDAKLNIAGWVGEQMGGARLEYLTVFSIGLNSMLE